MKRRITAVCLAVAGLGGLGLPGQPARATSLVNSPVVIDQSGVGMRGALVRNEHKWVITNQFPLPKGEWGVTYAYRCSGKGDFWMAVAQTNTDGTNPLTVVYRRKSRGSGYKMETGKVGPQIVQPSKGSPDLSTDLQTLQIDSRCRWHVRVVEGSRSVLAQQVPAIP